MESFGIIFSIPGSFVAGIVYAFVVKNATARLPLLIHPFQWVSVIVILLGLLEFGFIATIGALGLRAAVGGYYYPIHSVLFVLTLPAVVNIMQLQNRLQFLSKWYFIGSICALIGLSIVLQQYIVAEALFGVDGMEGPYGRP